ncbi:MAG TPA: hypothetical protein VK508_01680 [Cyclobacteriaceae bacterium]|nr:hypothetical protein [Cyclobacteriaceae bacterium]
MKKVFVSLFLLLFLFGVSCTTNEVNVNQFEAPGFSDSQLKQMGFTSLKIYNPDHKEYQKKTKKIRARYAANKAEKKLNQKISRTAGEGDPIPQNPEEPEGGGGGGIYVEATAPGRVVEILEVATLQFFSTVTLSNGMQDHDIFLTPRTPAANQPSFDYQVYNQNGLQGSSNPLQTQRTWWDCVAQEYANMCGGILNEIMCALAGMAAPELVLVVYASWMLSCAW